MDEIDATSAEETQDGALATTDEAASTEVGAPATPPEGFIEQSRYDNLRAETNRKEALWDRAQKGDIDAMRELNLPVDFGDEEEPADEDGENHDDPELADPVARQWIQQQEAQQSRQRFEADLNGLLAGKKLELTPIEREAVFYETVKRGDGPEALKTVVDDVAKQYAAREKATIDRFLKRKRDAPFVPTGGTGATEVTDPLDGNARRERLAARLGAHDED